MCLIDSSLHVIGIADELRKGMRPFMTNDGHRKIISLNTAKSRKTARTLHTASSSNSSIVNQPATTPQEMFRVSAKVLLAFCLMVLLPVGAAKMFQRGPMPDVSAWMQTTDALSMIRVYRTGSQTTVSVPLNKYILEVLCAEYTPKTPLSALEAAAAATRTYAVHAMLLASSQARTVSSIAGAKMQSSVAIRHHADVTNDSQLDLPMESEVDVESQFPNRAFMFLSHVQMAVEKTDGRVVTYQNQPILAFMFDVSPGWTRWSKVALGRNIPYLQRIACPDDAVDATRLSTNTFSSDEVARVFREPSVNLAKLKATRAPDGFVQSVTDGKRTVSASIFASKLHLPSEDFRWKMVKQKLRVTTYGRGTDLGMSLHEASILATKGQSWKAILSHFYPDTKIQLDDRYRI